MDITPDQGPATREQLAVFHGTYRVTASVLENPTCPAPDWASEPLVTGAYAKIDVVKRSDVRIINCSSPNTCDSTVGSPWHSGAIQDIAGTGFSGWYLTTSVVDRANGACNGAYVFRYIVATDAGARLEQRLRLSGCGIPSSEEPNRLIADPAVTPCECVLQSFELSRVG